MTLVRKPMLRLIGNVAAIAAVMLMLGACAAELTAEQSAQVDDVLGQDANSSYVPPELQLSSTVVNCWDDAADQHRTWTDTICENRGGIAIAGGDVGVWSPDEGWTEGGPFVDSSEGDASTSGRRVGAVCVDGSHSSATGQGACSHHGGVDYWLTE